MSLLVLCHTLAVTYRYYDYLIVTDRDTYLEDILAGTVQMLERRKLGSEQANAARMIFDFSDAVRSHRIPLASGPALLPPCHTLGRGRVGHTS